MTAITATATGGNWTSGATWVGGVAPTAADDAYLDATSGPVTINTGAVARSLDCTGYTGTLTHTAGVSLGLGDATAGAGNVALKLVAGMTYTLGSASTSGFSFVSTSATQQTITTAGKSLGNLYFFFAASYVLADANTVGPTATVNLLGGTLNTGNFACSWGLVVISGASAKTLTLGTSAITITGSAANSVDTSTGSNITYTANTSVFTFSGAASGFRSAGNWNGTSAVFGSGVVDARLRDGVTLLNVTRNGPAVGNQLVIQGGNPTITGTLTVNGNSTVNRLIVVTDAPGTARTVTAAAVSLSNADFQDITAAGAAIPWTGTSMGNALGNTNITFDTPVTQTYTGGTGNWSDVTKWTSRVPLAQDNVIVGAAASGTITADMPRLGADVNFTGFTGTAAFNSVANILYGSLTLGSGMTLSGAPTTTLAARSSKTITSNGKTFSQGITISAPGGTYTLVDALSLPGSGGLTTTAGTFLSANFPITGSFVSFSAGAVGTFGTSTVTLTSTGVATVITFSATATISAASATFIISNASANARSVQLGNQTIGTLTYTVAGSTGSLIFINGGTIGTLNFSDVTNARTLTITSGTMITVTTLNFNGTPGKLMTLNSSTPGSPATLTKASGPTYIDYLSVQDIIVSGSNLYSAGSTNVSGNSGLLTFLMSAVPAGGNWSAGATWSTGVVPTAADNVRLIASSGNVTIDTASVARSLDCLGYTGTLTHTAAVTLTLGDATAAALNVFRLRPGMTYTLGNAATSAVNFVSTNATQQNISSGGLTTGSLTFSGVGSSYKFIDINTIEATGTLTLSAGILDTGNFAHSWGILIVLGASAKTLTLGSSAIAITGYNAGNPALYNASGLTMTANTAVMTFSQPANVAFNWVSAVGGLSLVFTSTVTGASILNGPTGLFNVTVTGGAIKTTVFMVSINTTLSGTLTVTGNSAINRIIMNSLTIGTPSTITAAAVSFANVTFQDITAAGAAIPWTGTSMGNALGNSNITFDTPATQTRTGAGGNWSTAGNWTSRVPLPQDNVVVGAASSGTITADMPRLGADVSFAGFTGTASFASVANTLYGSLTLGSGMTVSGTQALTLAGRSAKTITSNTKAFSQIVNITAPGGTYTLVDAFVTASNFNVTDGTFSTGNFPLQAVLLGASGSGSRTISTGSSTITLTGTSGQLVDLLITGTTYNTSATAFVIATASASARSFATRGATFGTLTYTVAGSTGSLTFNGNNGANGGTFGTINFSDASNARSLLFNAGTTTTVTNWNVFGTAGKLMTVDSVTAATHTLSKPSANVTAADYLSIAHSIATGGAGWFAGVNSVDAGSNTGWQFADSPKTNFLEMF